VPPTSKPPAQAGGFFYVAAATECRLDFATIGRYVPFIDKTRRDAMMAETTDRWGIGMDRTSGKPATCASVGGAALIAGAAILAILSPAAAEEPASQPDAVTLQVENDLFGSGSDSHYTQGMRISWLPSPKTVPDWLREGALLVPGIDSKDHLTFVFAIGQNMYTPEDISRPEPDPADALRRLALCHLRLAVEDAQRNLLHNVAPTLASSPPFTGRPTQKMWHKLIGSPQPHGWSHQLDNEPGIVLTYEAACASRSPPPSVVSRSTSRRRPGWRSATFSLTARPAPRLRFGHNLDLDYGPPFIRPSCRAPA